MDLAFRLINIHKHCLVKLALISLCALLTGIIVMFAFAWETFSIVQILVIIMGKMLKICLSLSCTFSNSCIF